MPPAARSSQWLPALRRGAVARLGLVRTLRDLGLGLDVIRQVLFGRVTVAEVASPHAAALDTQIRELRLRRAVLRVLSARGSDIEEAPRMNNLARLSARERQHIVDDFVAGVFAGVAPGDPATSIAQRMRALPAELPDDPSAEQVDAWIELAELVADRAFQQRARQMALASGPQAAQQALDYPAVTEHAGRALAARHRARLTRGQGHPGPHHRARRSRPRAGLAARAAGDLHRRTGGAVLAAAGDHQRPAGAAVGRAQLRMADRRAPRGPRPAQGLDRREQAGYRPGLRRGPAGFQPGPAGGLGCLSADLGRALAALALTLAALAPALPDAWPALAALAPALAEPGPAL